MRLAALRAALPEIPEAMCWLCTHDHCECRERREKGLAELVLAEAAIQAAERLIENANLVCDEEIELDNALAALRACGRHTP